MRRFLLVSALLLSVLPFSACDTKKKFCDTCSSDSECDANDALACQLFRDGSYKCAHPAAPSETCP
jgi:hypothetical protein